MVLWFAGTAFLTVWLVFRDPAFDYRLVIVGALLAGRGRRRLRRLGPDALRGRQHRAAGRRDGGDHRPPVPAPAPHRPPHRDVPPPRLRRRVHQLAGPSGGRWPAGSLAEHRLPVVGRGWWNLALELVGLAILVWAWRRFGMAGPGPPPAASCGRAGSTPRSCAEAGLRGPARGSGVLNFSCARARPPWSHRRERSRAPAGAARPRAGRGRAPAGRRAGEGHRPARPSSSPARCSERGRRPRPSAARCGSTSAGSSWTTASSTGCPSRPWLPTSGTPGGATCAFAPPGGESILRLVDRVADRLRGAWRRRPPSSTSWW